MLKNQDIICISSIDWDFIWQQHQEIMSTFAKNGNRVLFIENTGVRPPVISDTSRIFKRISNWRKSVKGFRQEMENLYIFSPIVLPFPYSRLARVINKFLLTRSIERWSRVMGFQNPIIWTFLPTPLVLDIIDKIPHRALIYYCTDNFSATSKAAKKIVKYEQKVFKKADAVFVMARNMVNYCKEFNKNVTCVPMGVSPAIFEKSAATLPKPPELQNAKSKVIGFIGGLRQSIDQEMVAYLTETFCDYTFIFVGPIQTDISGFKDIKNVIIAGKKRHDELGAYLRYFDVAIIPYKKDDYTDNISAAKLNEYLVLGKPVVTTNLKETELFNKENGDILYIAKNKEEFAENIKKALKEDCEALRKKRIEVAYSNSWDRKIQQMSAIVEDLIKAAGEKKVNWQVALLSVYRNFRRKVIYIMASLILLWLAVFYTPLMWIIAKPLLIFDKPATSEAIVVFAGGAGESGEAGQGYEERVTYAVDLYKEGYAKNLIFSSGYTYVFKEPEMMKVLAVSLGVPESSIYLDDKARNTYENVVNTKSILTKKHWDKIILVSSPYHMRRVELVFKKNADEVEVTYLPIKDSLFYSHPIKDSKGRSSLKQINLSQIKGILHEYLGIVYYWFKGYI